MPPDRLYAQRTGAGPPVVLVHGFTQTSASWTALTGALVDAGHQVLSVDAPGHGRSSEVRADLEGAAEMLGRVGGGQASYVGYSMGGRLCLQLALVHPDTVQRLVLIGTSPGIADPVEREARRHADRALAAELEAGGDDCLPGFIDRWLAGPLFSGLPAAAAGREQRLTNRAAGLAASLRQVGTGAMTPHWDRLHELSMPVLVLVGERDTKFTETGRRMAAAIGANARFALVAGAGHAAHLERPSAASEAIVEFLR